MAKLKKVLAERFGASGLITLLQVLVFSLLVLCLHYLFFRAYEKAMPIVLAGGLISLQPGFVRAKIAVRRVVAMFGFGCALSFVMVLTFPGTPVFYLLALLIGFLIVTLFGIKPFPVTAFIPLNIVYWMGDMQNVRPGEAVAIFIEIAAGALIGLLIDRVIQLPLRKSLAAAYGKYALVLAQREQKFSAEDQTATNNLLLATLKQIEILQAVYVKRRDLQGRQAERLQSLFAASTRIFFTIQVMRDAPVAEHRAELFGQQYVDFRKKLQEWKDAAHEGT